ncbi:MAG: multiple sugar transport system ATP-binding protein [Ilumatobacter sp.]|jgi:multiple sugar transport system ATP-binding protein
MLMATVTLRKVNKVYENGFHAIHDLDLEIEDKEFLVLVGPSGCGKSTALRMIAGLETVTGGQMMIGDKVVNDVEPKDRDIAMVFQNYALYPHMTVYDNIGFALKLAKVPKDEIDKRVRQASKLLELDANLDRKPGQLSGGQRQRVAMGRAIVRQPAAFLMDEPLSNLDAKLRVQMRAEIAALQRDLAVTTVYVTHDQIEAMTMGDRVAVLKDGYLQQVDTPQNLYDRPDNVFVAAFIGSPSMNLYEASIDLVDGGGVVRLGSQTLTIDAAVFAARPALQSYTAKIIVGIRPEDYEDAAMVDHDTSGKQLTSTVKLVEALGSELMVHFDVDARTVDSGDPDAVEESDSSSNSVGRFHPRSTVRLREHVTVAVSTENMHFFDPETRLAIWD